MIAPIEGRGQANALVIRQRLNRPQRNAKNDAGPTHNLQPRSTGLTPPTWGGRPPTTYTVTAGDWISASPCCGRSRHMRRRERDVPRTGDYETLP